MERTIQDVVAFLTAQTVAREKTVDGLELGKPETPVKGIAVLGGKINSIANELK